MLTAVSVFVDVSCDLPIMGMLIQEKLTRPGRQSAWELRYGYFIQALPSSDHNCTVTDGQWWRAQVYSMHRNVLIALSRNSFKTFRCVFFFTPPSFIILTPRLPT